MKVAESRALRRADRAANRGYVKSRFVLSLLRSAQYWRSKRGPGRLLHVVVGGFYKVVSEWILGIEIPASTRVGPGLRLRHGVGVVVNPGVVIGEGVMLRHGVTLGNKGDNEECPVIGDFVEFGAGATVVGAVRIGEHARIAPGVLVTEDVPPWSLVLPPRPVVRPRKDAPQEMP
jgi:serine acetyltransferase